MDKSSATSLRERRRALFDRIYAFYEVKVLAMAGETGLFKALAEAPKTIAELVAATSVPERGVRALIISLGALELVAFADGKYRLSESGAEFFVEGSGSYMGDVVRFADWQFDALPRIDQAIRQRRFDEAPERSCIWSRDCCTRRSATPDCGS